MLFFQQSSKNKAMDIEQTRQEQLQKIGDYLKQTRLENNLDLSIISQNIHLPVSILNALENANLTKLPEPVFIKQLLKKYANFLQITEKSIYEQIDSLIFLDNSIPKTSQPRNYLGKISLNFNSKFLYPIYGILLILAVNSLNQLLQSSQLVINNNLEQLDILETSNSNQQNNDTKPEFIPAVETREENPPIPEKLVLKINVQEECWIRVIADGKIVFEKLLNQGFEQEWVAREKITIRAGNAGALTFSLNGGQPQKLGELGQVEEMTFELPQQS